MLDRDRLTFWWFVVNSDPLLVLGIGSMRIKAKVVGRTKSRKLICEYENIQFIVKNSEASTVTDGTVVTIACDEIGESFFGRRVLNPRLYRKAG